MYNEYNTYYVDTVYIVLLDPLTHSKPSVIRVLRFLGEVYVFVLFISTISIKIQLMTVQTSNIFRITVITRNPVYRRWRLLEQILI